MVEKAKERIALQTQYNELIRKSSEASLKYQEKANEGPLLLALPESVKATKFQKEADEVYDKLKK